MTTERRRYFRIDDSALINYRLVALQDLASVRAEITAHMLHTDNLREACQSLDTRLTELGPALRRESRAIAEAIDLLNRKLNLLTSVFSLESAPAAGRNSHEHQPAAINLSGGGLAIRATQGLTPDTWLAIDLVLLPGNKLVRTLGRVVDCRACHGGFAIGVEFDGLREEDRDSVISHVLRKQAEMLRRQRSGGEQGA